MLFKSKSSGLFERHIFFDGSAIVLQNPQRLSELNKMGSDIVLD